MGSRTYKELLTTHDTTYCYLFKALFYLDVAKRAVDEVVSIGAIAGLGSGALTLILTLALTPALTLTPTPTPTPTLTPTLPLTLPLPLTRCRSPLSSLTRSPTGRPRKARSWQMRSSRRWRPSTVRYLVITPSSLGRWRPSTVRPIVYSQLVISARRYPVITPTQATWRRSTPRPYLVSAVCVTQLSPPLRRHGEEVCRGGGCWQLPPLRWGRRRAW